MLYDDEQIDVSVFDSILEPLLSQSVLYFLDDNVVGIVGEIKEEPQRQHTDSLILGGKFLESLGQGPLLPTF